MSKVITLAQVTELSMITTLAQFCEFVRGFAAELQYCPGELMVSDWLSIEREGASKLQILRAEETIKDVFDYWIGQAVVHLKDNDSVEIDGYDVILTKRFKNGNPQGHNLRYLPKVA